MILLTGDSNYREVYKKFKNKIEDETKEKVIFKQYTTNESLKLVLAGENGKERPKVFLIGAGLNEAAAKSKSKGKGRDEILRSVANEQNTIVLKQAEKDKTSLFGMTPPFLRLDPAWIGEKHSLMFFYMRNYSLKFNSGNLYVGSPVDIEASDLGDDKVHLNDSGLAKLADMLISDALVALKDVAILRNPEGVVEDVELASSQLSDWARTPTPTGKRTRNEDTDDSNASKRSKPTTTSNVDSTTELISTLNQFMQQMRDDRKADSDIIKKVELSQNSIVEKQKETEEKVEKLTDIVTTDNDIFASMKEDVDASENEMLRNTVIVKKWVSKEKIPTDKKELSKFIQDNGRSLVNEVLGEGYENEVKFVSTLFTREPREPREAPARDAPNFFPPFKLVFKTKETGIKFREKVVKMSKEGKEGLEKTYVTHQQNAATRIRSSLMWGVVEGLKKKGKEAWVNQNINKPNIQIKEGGKIVKTLTFMQAMKEHSKIISAKVLSDVSKTAAWNFSGQMERYFIVLKD